MLDPCGGPPPRLLLDAIAQFNRGEYFEQHETLEALWRVETRDVRRFYQGLLQLGVAFHHVRRCNPHGARVMLDRGLSNVSPFAPACHGIDVTRLVADARAALDHVRTLGSDLQAFDWRYAVQVRFRACEQDTRR